MGPIFEYPREKKIDYCMLLSANVACNPELGFQNQQYN